MASVPIGLLACVYAAWEKTRRPELAEWDHDKAGFWDTAVAGSAALQAALRRKLSDEVCSVLDIPAATLYWDVEKFYDSVVPHKLIEAALQLSYPPLRCYTWGSSSTPPLGISAPLGAVSATAASLTHR